MSTISYPPTSRHCARGFVSTLTLFNSIAACLPLLHFDLTLLATMRVSEVFCLNRNIFSVLSARVVALITLYVALIQRYSRVL